MSVEKAKEFLAALQEKEPDEALNEKAAAAKTEDEKLAFTAEIAHEMGYNVTEADIKEAREQESLVALDDDALESVAAGDTRKDWLKKYHSHTWEKTGNTRPGQYIKSWEDVEYKCKTCGERMWDWW